jgi:hypothetical protein
MVCPTLGRSPVEPSLVPDWFSSGTIRQYDPGSLSHSEEYSHELQKVAKDKRSFGYANRRRKSILAKLTNP